MSAPNPARRFTLVALSAMAAAMAMAGWLAAGETAVPRLSTVDPRVMFVVVTLLFAGAERYKLHFDVRDISLTASLSAFPLVIGLASMSIGWLLVSQLLARALTRSWGRNGLPLVAFNLGIGVFETGVTGWLTTLWLGTGAMAGPWMASMLAVMLCDIASTCLVLAGMLVLRRPVSRRQAAGLLGSMMASGAMSSSLAGPCVVSLSGGVWSLGLLAMVTASLLAGLVAYRRMQRENSSQEALLLAAQRMNAVDSRERVLEALRDEAIELVGARGALVRPRRTTAQHDRALPGHGEVPCCIAAETERPDERSWLAANGHLDALIVPLQVPAAQPLALVVHDRRNRSRSFTPGDLARLQTLVAMADSAGHRLELDGRLLHEIAHDPLTGLLNRPAFAAAVGRRIGSGADAADAPPTLTGVLLLALVRFKTINDVLGHATGDRVLVAVARRLDTLRGPQVELARFGGDEFALLLPGVTAPDELERLATQLLASFEEPLCIDDIDVDVAVRIGMAVWRPGDVDVDGAALLRQADAACTTARERGTTCAWYLPPAQPPGTEQLGLAGQLRRAIAEDAIDVAFQPQVEVATGRVVGFEALARWSHPERGAISPAQFIPLADQTGQIELLTRCVLRKSLAACATWPEPLAVSVNLSARLLADPRLPQKITAALGEARLAPHRLMLELTEDCIVDPRRETMQQLQRLRELGLRLSIDDFGTGYSSLAYLRRLPAQELKIDRSFMEGAAERGSPAHRLLGSIVDVAHVLGLVVVAEGVEDEPTLRALATLGCDLAQGWHLGRPMPAAAIAGWLAGRAGGAASPPMAALERALPAR